MGRIERSWKLVKASVGVLDANRSLLLFPLLSSLCALVVSATFLLPLFASGVLERGMQGGGAWYAPMAFAFYLVQYFIIFFFNAALVGAARIHLDGGHPSFSDGLRIAGAHWPQILGYAALAATVGMLLRAIEQRAGFIGSWIVGLLGVAWTVAAFLVVPVLVNEQTGPVDAVRRSADLLKRTWGENLAGNVGMGFVFGALTVLWTGAWVGGAVFAFAHGAFILGGVLAILALLGGLLLTLVQTALQGVYAAVLYRYAATGETGNGFDQALVAQAFRVKA